MSSRVTALVLVVVGAAAASAQTDARAQLALGHRLWEQRLANSAIAAFEAALKTPEHAPEALEALGRIYVFKGWQQEGAFPGWHDETEARGKARAALRRAVALDPKRASAAQALTQVYAFAASPTVVPPAPARREVTALDAKIEAWPNSKAPATELEALITARVQLQADPAPYFAAAQMMIERKEYARAVDFADRGRVAAARFMNENESAYLMVGKFRNARARSHATWLTIRGIVALERMDFSQADDFLQQADRLTHGQDATVQARLGDLAMARKDLEQAQDRYLNALSLTGASAPLKMRVTEALMGIRASLEDSAGFDAWLEETVGRRREDRRKELLRSVVDRALPPLAMTGLDGKRLDLASFRGKALLLNFFSSW